MAAFLAAMGMAYLEINKLPCLHKIYIPVYKCVVLECIRYIEQNLA
jgi:hypothetical protein